MPADPVALPQATLVSVALEHTAAVLAAEEIADPTERAAFLAARQRELHKVTTPQDRLDAYKLFAWTLLRALADERGETSSEALQQVGLTIALRACQP